MRSMKVLFIVLLILASTHCYAQESFDFSHQHVIQRLKQDVYTLASDEMEGREAATEGERRAASYIKQQMQQIGLKPLFGDSYLQEFTFPGPLKIAEDNFIVINDIIFRASEDYFILPISANVNIHLESVEVGQGLNTNEYKQLQDIEGKLFVIEYFASRDIEHHSGMSHLQIARQKIDIAIESGAAGIIFVNTDSDRANPRLSSRGNIPPVSVPVVFAGSKLTETLLSNPGAGVKLSTDIQRQSFTAYNVAGYLDNNAETTVVLGGHYDHLGWGGAGSRSPGVHAIHPGADDNASGIAGVLEAARYLSNSDLTANNYIFIAFTAEEKGLLGSRYFVDSDAYDMGKVNFMFNYDMIGRMDNNSLALIGTGTSPAWDVAIDKLAPGHFNIRRRPGGMGGSDHTSFYLKDIPVIFFFTGSHEDYHQPGDTPEKVNYHGAKEILDFSLDMISYLETLGRLEFTPTPTEARQQRTQNVTLGIMPDHTFEGSGLKIQAVVQDRPAQKAGLATGDVIVRIGENQVQDIYTYMSGLETLRTGQTVTVVVIRQGEEVTFNLAL
jgi:aminopeptidase YwaD